MSKFRITREELEKLVERARKEAARQTNILSGVEKTLIVFDASERPNDIRLGVYDTSDGKMKVVYLSKFYVDSEAVARLISIISGLRNAVIRAKVLGTRIMALMDVDEYREGWDERHGISVGTVVKRGGRVWLDTPEGLKLVSDFSIKGALLAEQAVDGDQIVYVGIEGTTNSGVPVIQFIDWDRIEASELEETGGESGGETSQTEEVAGAEEEAVTEEGSEADISAEEIAEIERQIGGEQQ